MKLDRYGWPLLPPRFEWSVEMLTLSIIDAITDRNVVTIYLDAWYDVDEEAQRLYRGYVDHIRETGCDSPWTVPFLVNDLATSPVEAILPVL
jgi:hypothetical protein